MPEPGEVILARIPFTDSSKVKKRPAVVLFQEMGNVVVAGITSNLEMKGVPLSKEEGAVKESVIKLNYIFTISDKMVEKPLFELPEEKKKRIFKEVKRKLGPLKGE